MSLLSRLAGRIPGLNNELAATEALGLLLADADAADLLAATLRTVAPHIPSDIRFSTQAGDADGRPDIVGRVDGQEVAHLEGKFWAGLTPAQSDGKYLERLRKQRRPGSPHEGLLVFVVPPRRAPILQAELLGSSVYGLAAPRRAGAWWAAEATAGPVVAVTTWDELLTRLAGATRKDAAEDARQLLDLVRRVDHGSFVPWTTEQLTDQDVPRRVLRLAHTVSQVHAQLIREGTARPESRRQTITGGGPLAFGKRMFLADVVVTLRVSLDLWAQHGRSPLWLSFGTNAVPLARRALPEELIESDGWFVVPVPVKVDALEEEVLEQINAWMRQVRSLLLVALDGERPPATDDEDRDRPEEELGPA